MSANTDNKPEAVIRIDYRLIVAVSVMLLIVFLIANVIITAVYKWYDARSLMRAAKPTVVQEAQAVVESQQFTLSTYAWQDEANGVLAIPLGKARELMLANPEKLLRSTSAQPVPAAEQPGGTDAKAEIIDNSKQAEDADGS
jgi:hypothetical protein